MSVSEHLGLLNYIGKLHPLLLIIGHILSLVFPNNIAFKECFKQLLFVKILPEIVMVRDLLIHELELLNHLLKLHLVHSLVELFNHPQAGPVEDTFLYSIFIYSLMVINYIMSV